MSRSDAPRSRLSIGMEWASRVTTVGLEFALPPLLGAWIDQWWRFSPLAVLLGAALGFAVGMMHLLQIARLGAATSDRPSKPPDS